MEFKTLLNNVSPLFVLLFIAPIVFPIVSIIVSFKIMSSIPVLYATAYSAIGTFGCFILVGSRKFCKFDILFTILCFTFIPLAVTNLLIGLSMIKQNPICLNGTMALGTDCITTIITDSPIYNDSDSTWQLKRTQIIYFYGPVEVVNAYGWKVQ